jgi:hypothetical protein
MDLIKIIEKINEVGLSNNDLTRYGDGFEDAIFKVKEVITELYKQDQTLQLQQTGVSTCFLEDYIDDLFGNEITYKQTSCCKIAPITNEKYCPNCGNKILK